MHASLSPRSGTDTFGYKTATASGAASTATAAQGSAPAPVPAYRGKTARAVTAVAM
jgi:hypothetical protein